MSWRGCGFDVRRVAQLRAKSGCMLQVTMQIKGHTDDVNAIAYLDDSNNVLISGSDDTLVKVCFS